jgi:hypothetical protein
MSLGVLLNLLHSALALCTLNTEVELGDVLIALALEVVRRLKTDTKILQSTPADSEPLNREILSHKIASFSAFQTTYNM